MRMKRLKRSPVGKFALVPTSEVDRDVIAAVFAELGQHQHNIPRGVRTLFVEPDGLAILTDLQGREWRGYLVRDSPADPMLTVALIPDRD